MSAGFVPDRGDLIRLTLPELSAVVLSPRAYNDKVGYALVCPITRKGKGYPWEVALPFGLPISGAVLSDRLKSLDWRSRSADKIGSLPPRTVAEILGKLNALLSF